MTPPRNTLESVSCPAFFQGPEAAGSRASQDGVRLLRLATRTLGADAACLATFSGGRMSVTAACGLAEVREGSEYSLPVDFSSRLARKRFLSGTLAEGGHPLFAVAAAGGFSVWAAAAAAEGALFVFRVKPSRWEAGQLSDLADFAAMARLRKPDEAGERAEAKLRRALDQVARQQFALDQHAIVALTDLDGVITYANDKFCEASGYSREELVGKNHRLLRSGVHAPEFFGEMFSTLSQRKIWRGEICNRAKDGKLYWVATTITPFLDEDGELDQYAAISTDISALKGLAEELRLSKEWLSSVIEALSDGLVVRDRSGRVVSVNAAAERLLGVNRDDMAAEIQAAWEGWVVHEDGSVFPTEEQPFFHTIRTGEPRRDVVMGFRRAEDMLGWISVNTQPVRNSSGEIVAVVSNFTDITQRMNSDRALRDSEALLRTFVEHAPAAVAMFDRQMRYLVVSRQWYCDYRLADRDLTGQCHYDVFPEIPDRWKEDHRRALAGNVIRTDADLFVRADGSSQWLSYELRPWRHADGTIGGLVMFTRDITAQKKEEEERARFEQKLMEAQKLESLGVLAGGIAHDFNNILTGIMGNNSLALSLLPEGSPLNEPLSEVHGATQRAADLVKQMLAYSGRGKFVVQKLDLSRVVEETAKLVGASISKKVRLCFDLAAGLPPVEADSAQVRQVVMNLVINAAEAMGEAAGDVRIRTFARQADREYLNAPETVVDAEPGNYVCIEVEDTGCGISEENLRRIFDPFFTTKFAGRGLGLAAVLGIVRGHKGSLRVVSEAGRGTTFTMLLPSSTGPCDNSPHTPVTDDAWRGSGTVLVVEDEETVRSTVQRILNVFGFTVVLAADGREGVDLFLREPKRFALVLLDLTMPCLDGAQVFSEIRRRDKNVPVVLMSGFGEQEAKAKFAGRSLNGFIQKPFDLRTLQRVVKAALEGRKSNGSGS